MHKFEKFEFDIDKIFAFYEPKTLEARLKHEAVREYCRNLAAYLNEVLPPDFEKVMAIYSLQACMMHAQQAIANQAEDQEEVE